MTPPSQEIERVKAQMSRWKRGFGRFDVQRWRKALDSMAAFYRPRPGISIQQTRLGGVPAEEIKLEKPDGAPPTMPLSFLYFHGGGFVGGSPGNSRPLLCNIARRLDCRVFSIDYRLAPENPFPAAWDDAWAATTALAGGVSSHDPAHATTMANGGVEAGAVGNTRPGVSRNEGVIVLGGDSAGGGLALSTAMKARDSGGPAILGLVLISPWTDLACTGESHARRAGDDPVLDPVWMETVVGKVLGHGAPPPTDPAASPLFGDMNGLPPTLIICGSDEILLDDSIRLAEKMEACGVDVTLHVVEGLFHAYPLFSPGIPEVKEATRWICDFLQGCLHGGARMAKV